MPNVAIAFLIICINLSFNFYYAFIYIMLAILTYMDLACVIFTKKITMRFCLLIVSFLPFYFLVFSLLCIMRECEQESWIFFLSSAFLDSFLSSLFISS